MSHIVHSISDDAVATITLDYAPQNRIDDEMVQGLDDAVDATVRSSARAVVLNAGGPDFSFGGDISIWPLDDPHALRQKFDWYLRVFNAFERIPLPVVAAVQGLCFGGGLELALRADVILAGEGARFGHPEQSIGITTILGGVYRVAERAGRAFASEWSMTSEQVPAAVMQAHGVINRVVPDEDLQAEALAFATKVAGGPTLAYAAHKTLLAQWATGGVAAADAAVLPISMPLFRTSDATNALATAVEAMREGRPRPAMTFNAR